MTDFQSLSEIRISLEKKFLNFPKGKCKEAVKMVNEILGYEIFEGIIMKDKNPQHHFFNYDSESNAYIDLSSDQFPEFSEKILITPKENNNIYFGIKGCETV